MKISEVITLLESIKEQKGDVEVWVSDGGHDGEFMPFGGVIFKHEDKRYNEPYRLELHP
jgi:hypothetical protein